MLVPGAGDGGSWVDVERSDSTPPSALLSFCRGTGGSVAVRLVGDEPIRVAVALVDAMRGAESEPGPAEVKELAEVIASTAPTGRGYSPDPEQIARAALRWMREREAGS